MRFLLLLYLYCFNFNYFRFSLIIMSAYPKDVCLMVITAVGLKRVVSDRDFRSVIFPFLLIIFLITNLSSLYLLVEKGVPFPSLVKRLVIQSFRFLLGVLEIYLGFAFLNYIKTEQYLKLQYFLMRLLIGAGVYQFIAFHSGGLPYWGLAINRSIIAPSANYGIRPNSFIGEPKTFAVFAIVALSFFLYMYMYEKISLSSFVIWGALSLFCFVRAESGNGILGVVILLSIHFLISRVNYYFKAFICCAGLYLGYMVFSQPELFFSRNLSVLIAFSNLDFNTLLYSMDDLILLPVLALIGNKICIFFGFGYGLLTFYANDYMEYSSWLIKYAGTNFNIDSNVAVLGFICNYGVLLMLLACTFVVKQKQRLAAECKDTDLLVISSFLFNCFFLGLFITGNKVALYFSLGFFLRLNSLLLEKKTE
ncbi:MAG: hypothetical protein KC646_06215 [Candidatus Cloacimonetes bacterium]|nr:hypothetical protein [Candidatus Cloacimonadota bacterium]